VEEMAVALEEPGRGRRDSLRVAPQVREGNLFVVAAVKDESWWQLRGRVWPVLRERPLEFPVLLSAPERNGDQQETRDRLAALRLSDLLEQRPARQRVDDAPQRSVVRLEDLPEPLAPGGVVRFLRAGHDRE